MEPCEVEGGSAEVRRLAKKLLEQGQHVALAGLLEQASAILAQVWQMTYECAPHYANIAAWEAGGLLLRMGSYDEAARWFGRVSAFPDRKSPLWPALRQTLVQHCLEHAKGVPAVAPNESSVVQGAAPPQAPPASLLPCLQVVSLGQFQLRRGGAVLPTCTSYKAIALFRYLLRRRNRSAHKDELLELLWPGLKATAATHNLHVTISALRHYLDTSSGSYLLFENGRYLINPSAPLEDDCRHFEHCIDEGERCWRAGELARAQVAYTEAIACYQGDYYVGEQDGDWALAEQERLLMRYQSALDHLGRISIGAGQFEAAIGWYQRLLERDSYREDAHCQIMRCYWKLGRRNEALRQYRRCASILANELGLTPMEETQALYRVISSGTKAPAERHAAPAGANERAIV